MELITALRLLRKWAWLLTLGAVLVGGTAYFVWSMQPEKYRVSTIVAVGTTLEMPNPDSTLLTTGEDLARTYAVLARTHEVLDAAIEAGNYPVTVQELSAMVSAYPISSTALVEIELTYKDPVLAADIANEIARQLVNKSPSNLTEEQQNQLDLANSEIKTLNQELKQIRDELAVLDAQLLSANDPDEMRLLREQRYTLTTIIDDKSRNIAEFTKIAVDFQQRTNKLTIVETAMPQSDPIGLQPVPAGLAGGLLGVLAAAGIALLIEYFDESIPSSTEAAQLLKLPVFATISRFGRRRDNYNKRLIAYHQPDALATEGYRALRTNLLYHSNGISKSNGTSGSNGSSKKLSTYIVTSPGEHEGKTVTTANLAVTMALAGLRVLLIDADLRNPTLHCVFGLDNANGLSKLVLNCPPDMVQGDEAKLNSQRQLEEAIQETNIPGLRVITGGPTPINPSELLGSDAMQHWIKYFQSISDIDILLIDTPPVLSVTDASALAASGSLPILLVIHARKTRSDEAVKAKEHLDVLGTHVLGVVLNAANPNERYIYHRYG